MARSHNTKPLRLRMNDPGFSWRKTTNRESLVGVGRGDTKRIKRASHKRNRRRSVPHESMRGYGYGEDNYRYAYAD